MIFLVDVALWCVVNMLVCPTAQPTREKIALPPALSPLVLGACSR